LPHEKFLRSKWNEKFLAVKWKQWKFSENVMLSECLAAGWEKKKTKFHRRWWRDVWETLSINFTHSISIHWFHLELEVSLSPWFFYSCGDLDWTLEKNWFYNSIDTFEYYSDAGWPDVCFYSIRTQEMCYIFFKK
jgi:hypothetical protein